MSTGLPTLASGGQEARAARPRVASENSTTVEPCGLTRVDGQDARAAGVGDDARRGARRAAAAAPGTSRCRTSRRWCRRGSRPTAGRARRRRRRSAARPAVWLPAARDPACVRPAFTTTIGLLRPTRRASRAKRRGLPNDSRYSRITRGAGIALPVLEQVVAGHVGLVAEADERRHARRCAAGELAESPAPARRSATSSATPPARRHDRRERGVEPHAPALVLSRPMQLGPTIRMP